MPIIIDGYNFIGQCRFTSLSEEDKEEKLIRRLAQYQSAIKQKVTVVFDGQYSELHMATTEKRGGITIRYSCADSTADDLIKHIIRNDTNSKMLTVVTADNDIRLTAKQQKCRLLSPEEFEREMDKAQSGGSEKSDKPVSQGEVEGWLREFGEG
ncbi:MAG: NYN domain-containing protein [Candidatus Margulisiibacteriota bacterium]